MDDAIFDYVIVGAGSAGCALASRLSGDGRYSVALLEAGGRDRSIWIHIPLGVGKLLGNETYAWPFQSEPQAHMAGQPIYSPRGKVLGGSSALNGMAYVWGDPAIYDAWAANGLAGWDFASLKPYFMRMENALHSASPERGHAGPVKITDLGVRDPDPLSDAFIAACGEAGIGETADYNTRSYEGVRYLEQTAENGRRCSAAVAYLHPIASRRGLRVETHAHATRVLFDGDRACGVEFSRDGERHTVTARREIVLAAGTIQSPQLLELSGIGGRQRLADLGIPLVHDNPAVGEGISDHLQVRCTYETHIPITINDLMRKPLSKIRFAWQYLTSRTGPLAGTSSKAHAITRSTPVQPRADVMVRIYHISGQDRYSRSATGGIDPYSGFTIGGFKLSPVSRGSIHIVSADPFAAPALQPNYLKDEADLRTAVDLLALVRHIADQPSLREVIVAERRPGSEVTTEAELADYIRASGQTAWHTVGACAMGAAGKGVVDERLRVHGVRGLRVAD
ncbi:MAG: GMC family oxidoreductase N-terminal domain-containing protein, partial [Gammaproteobacteria bacterium]|nr:GMC family oxidoreductase N-terminal domain-containing protein [Gammaproteobacteria bacterium]